MVFGTELADLTVGGMAARTEYRASRALALVRVGTSFFAYIPLFVWGSLADPWVTVGAAVAATAATVLAGAAIVGFSFGFGVVQAGAVLLLMTGWVFAVLPDVTIKLPSDLLGFVLWYVISAVFIRELRMLAQLTDRAQREAQRSAVETEAARLRDRGSGFDQASVLPGGGFSVTFEALRRHGGDRQVASQPGQGTTVTLSWQPEAGQTDG